MKPSVTADVTFLVIIYCAITGEGTVGCQVLFTQASNLVLL